MTVLGLAASQAAMLGRLAILSTRLARPGREDSS